MPKRNVRRWTAREALKAGKAKKRTEPPMCRLCMSRHWSYQPHHFKPVNG